MTRALSNAGGSKEEQEKILIAMLANIMGPIVEIAVIDKTATKNFETPPSAPFKETTANKATARRRSIPSSINPECTNPLGKGVPPPV